MKRIPRILLFFLVLGLLTIPLTQVLIPKDNTKSAGMLYSNANAIRSQPKNSIDVLFIGTSEFLCGISPLDIWNDSGIASFNCSCSRQQMPTAQELLETALQTQSPKVVVVNTDIFQFDCHYYDLFSHQLAARLPFLRYHDRWKSLTFRDFSQTPRYTAKSPYRGFRLKTEVQAADLTDYMKPTSDRRHLSRWAVLCIKQMQALCRENNAQMVLFSVPAAMYWDYSDHNAMVNLAADMGVPYVDGNLEDCGLDWNVDTFDKGIHLNFRGAEKISHYLSGYLKSNFDLPDHRGEAAYAQWDTDYLALQEKIAQLAADAAS